MEGKGEEILSFPCWKVSVHMKTINKMNQACTILKQRKLLSIILRGRTKRKDVAKMLGVGYFGKSSVLRSRMLL